MDTEDRVIIHIPYQVLKEVDDAFNVSEGEPLVRSVKVQL